MSYFESSVRVPLLISYPKKYAPHRVTQNVSTLDILPTMVDLIGKELHPGLPMDGKSLLPFLEGRDSEGHDTVIAEYTGEGTVSPMMMIKRANWKFVICPADGVQLYDLENDPLEVRDLAPILSGLKAEPLALEVEYKNKAEALLATFEAEARERWDFESITEQVKLSQRKRRFVFSAFTADGTEREKWDFNPVDDGREKSVKSSVHSRCCKVKDIANAGSFILLAGTSARTCPSTSWSVWLASRLLTAMATSCPRGRPSKSIKLVPTGSK